MVRVKLMHCVRSMVPAGLGDRNFPIMCSRSCTPLLNPRGGDFAQHGKLVIFLIMT